MDIPCRCIDLCPIHFPQKRVNAREFVARDRHAERGRGGKQKRGSILLFRTSSGCKETRRPTRCKFTCLCWSQPIFSSENDPPRGVEGKDRRPEGGEKSASGACTREIFRRELAGI